MGTPAARKIFQRGEQARLKGDWLQAAKDYRRAIDLDPNYTEAHSQFIFATEAAHEKQEDAATKHLKQLYQGWAREHPKQAVYVWALGELCGENLARAEQYYLKALALDPSFAPADLSLSSIADSRGDNALGSEYLKKAAEANPRNPQYLFEYAFSVRKVDPALYARLSLEVIKRFPQSESAAQTLYWLAAYASTPQEKTADLERLRAQFPPSRFNWSESGMEDLFNVYMQASPDKAWALARQMAATLPDPDDRDEFRTKVTFAGNVVKAEALMASQKYAQAEALLGATKVPKFDVDATRYELDRAKALEGAGEKVQAYRDLLALVAHQPNQRLEIALRDAGAKIGKTPEQTGGDVWRKRDEASKPAKAFTLMNYDDGKPVSLASFRGQIVLLDFWFPACGPCQGSFPYLEDVLEKYRSKRFVILAVNVQPEQDKDVVPFLQRNHYGFVPLKSDWQWAAKNYSVSSTPATFLIDGQGRIVFKPHVGDSRGEKLLDREVDELLARETAKPSDENRVAN